MLKAARFLKLQIELKISIVSLFCVLFYSLFVLHQIASNRLNIGLSAHLDFYLHISSFNFVIVVYLKIQVNMKLSLGLYSLVF